MIKNYPGYRKYGGLYSKHEIYTLIGASPPSPALSNCDTSALRLSITLNRLDSQHKLGTAEILISKTHSDSITGSDSLQYIYTSTSYGPFLARKYRSPEIYFTKTADFDPHAVLRNIDGRQGIIRIVTFHRKDKTSDARIMLWDRHTFHQAGDLSRMHHIISIEFWELT